MKKISSYIAAVLASLACFSCIDDKTTGAHIPISDITITIPKGGDVVYIPYGIATPVQYDVTQTMPDMELKYEWADIPLTSGSIGDTVKILGNTKDYGLRLNKLGEHKVRLRVSNAHGSTFQYFKVMVQAAFQQGLFILSVDDQKQSRSSFLRTKNEDDVLTSTEEMHMHALEKINSKIDFKDITDVVMMCSYQEGQDRMFAISRENQQIFRYETSTFELIQEYKAKDIYDIKPKAFVATQSAWMGPFPILDESGVIYPFNLTTGMLEKDVLVSKAKKYASLYVGETSSKLPLFFAVSTDGETVEYFCYKTNAEKGSGDLYKGREIIGFTVNNDVRFISVDVNKTDRTECRVVYNPLAVGWGQDPFASPKIFTYTTNNLTVTKNSIMIALKDGQAYYSNGKKLYRWIYNNEGSKLPTESFKDFDGEITAMSLSGNGKWLYIGTYNPDAKTELKGNVYVFDHTTRTIVKEFIGVCDKPVKVFFKETGKMN